METSDLKTAKTTSGGYFKVSVIKISAQSDEFRGRLSMAQSCGLYAKPHFEKNEKKFETPLIFF